MKGIKKAFTLVELVIVITILAILGTIAFISMEGYSKQARDSTRVSDIQSIKTTLELFSLDAGKYPLPDDGETVSFSGELLRTQGFIGDTVTTNLSRNLSKKPTDPLSNAEYIYSVTNVQTEFEVLSVYEGDMIVGNNLINNSYASDNFKPKIDGTYNGIFVKSPNFIVPTPSIINSEILPLDLKYNPDAIDSSVISGGENMPDTNITRVPVQTGGLDINLSVYDGTIDSNSTDQDKIDAITKIQNAYSGSELADQEPYSNIVSITESEDLIAMADFTILNSGTPPLTTTLISVPTIAAGGISFGGDTDGNTDQISGDVTITAATSEIDITDYVLYWGTISGKSGGAITTISTNGGNDLFYKIPENTNKPSIVTYLWVYTKNENGEMEEGVGVEIFDDNSLGKDVNFVTSANNYSVLFKEKGGYLYYMSGSLSGTYPNNYREKSLYKLDVSNNLSLIKTMNYTGVLSSYSPNLVHADNFSYFAGVDQDHGVELWRTDGTESGTYMIKDINTGIDFSSPSMDINYSTYIIDGDILYFVADDGVHGKGLWRSDGTESGTYLLKDIITSGGDDKIYFLIKRGTDIYFSANNSDIWKTDGTTIGTTYIGVGASNFYRPFLVNDIIYFGTIYNIGYSKIDNLDVITDLPIRPDFVSSSPYSRLHGYNGNMTNTYSLPYMFYTCIITDNSIAITTAKRFAICRKNMDTLTNGDLFKNDIIISTDYYAHTTYIEMGGEKYTKCRTVDYTSNSYLYNNSLCKINTDGSDISVIFTTGQDVYFPTSLIASSSEVYFLYNNSTTGNELYKTDGTTTALVKDLNPGTGDGVIYAPVIFNDKVYFIGNNGANYGLYFY